MSRYFPLEKSVREIKTEDLLELKTISEGWYCEYKREIGKAISIAKSVSALANSHGGWIFYGVEQDRLTRCAARAPGIPLQEVSQAEVWLRQAVSGSISPTVYYEHVFLSGPLPALGLDDQHCVLAVFVPEGINAPYLHSSGRIYRRIADESDPKEECDRQVLDVLFRRSKVQRKRIEQAIYKSRRRLKLEGNPPCLRVLFFHDLWDEREGSELLFEAFKRIMSSGFTIFDNFYSTTFGHIARMTYGNNPSRTVYSWHHQGWFEEVLFPFSWFPVPQGGFPYNYFSEFKIGAEFLNLCRVSQLEGLTVIEMSGLFQSTIGLCQKLEAVLDRLSCNRSVYFKIQLSGIWRGHSFLGCSVLHRVPARERDASVSGRCGVRAAWLDIREPSAVAELAYSGDKQNRRSGGKRVDYNSQRVTYLYGDLQMPRLTS